MVKPEYRYLFYTTETCVQYARAEHVDAKTDEDITHNVLTQIIMEEESRGETMLPVNFLRQLISMYGDSMQAMVPGYLEASMDSFRRNQEQFKSAVEGAFANTPFADLAKRNLAMFEAATQGFKPGAVTPAPTPTPCPPRSKAWPNAPRRATLLTSTRRSTPRRSRRR